MNTTSDDGSKRGGEYVYDVLVDAGVEVLFGLPGTQTLPLDRTIVERDEIDYVMARHETAIPHMAWGYYESSGKIAATLTVPGPGDTNAMHGLKNAYEDCVPLVHVSADVNPEDRGKGPIHEIEPDTFDNAVKANVTVENRHELPAKAAEAVEIATSAPYGPVRLGVPSRILEGEFDAATATVEPETVTFDADDGLSAAADLVESAERPVVWIGGGVRRSPTGAEAVGSLARDLDAPVIATYKGKGVFPEDDPRFVGVGASYLPAGGERLLESADVVLAFGTDFDGLSTSHWELPMGDRLVHVGVDPGEFGRSYEPDVAVPADAGEAAEALHDRVDVDATASWDGAAVGSAVREEWLAHLDDLGVLDETEPAQTPATLRALRDVIPREAVVTTDVGGFRLWGFEVFEAYDQRSYVSAGSWAGMGVGLPAAVGAKVANPDRPVVSLHGDGGFMMCAQELHTIAEHGLDVTVVLFNNRDYGTISKSPKIDQYTQGSRFNWTSPDFTEVAEGFGVRGVSVSTPSDAREAVADALDREGPTLVNVDVQTDETSVKEAADYESTVEF